jgi:hypothetical protein
MKKLQAITAILVLVSFGSNAFSLPMRDTATFFDNIQLIQPNGEKLRETSVRVVFEDDKMRVLSRSNGAVLKEFSYDKIQSAEYSYTKNPRWKTGLGLGAAGVLFPPLWLIAIPIGFTKHRRHWVTVRTDNDYAVLKVGKGVRKVFMPAFETRTSVSIKALGDDK